MKATLETRVRSLFILVAIGLFVILYSMNNLMPYRKKFLESLDLVKDAVISINRDTSFAEASIQTTDRNNCKTLSPVVAIHPREWHRFPGKKWRGLQLPVLTMKPGGGFGNAMGNYATLYAIGRAYDATVRVSNQTYIRLSRTFPNMSMPIIPADSEKEWMKLEVVASFKYANFEAAAAGILGPHPFIGTGSPIQIQLFHAFACEIRREFTFSPAIQTKVRQFWLNEAKFPTASVLVGIHIRRTDYINYMKWRKSAVPGVKYFRNAMAFYRTKFPGVLFVAASDDRKYIENIFANDTDVILAPGSPKELDMAVLASCNHSIITFGTFGFWTGYLAGGLVLYPNHTLTKNYPLQREWYEMSHLDNFIPIESDHN